MNTFYMTTEGLKFSGAIKESSIDTFFRELWRSRL